MWRLASRGALRIDALHACPVRPRVSRAPGGRPTGRAGRGRGWLGCGRRGRARETARGAENECALPLEPRLGVAPRARL